MKYQTIDALDSRIEKIVKSTVKHYFTDWKHYDRPKYMKCKGSNDTADKKLILLVRETGTYLIRTIDVFEKDSWAETLYKYFQTQEKSDYYMIDISRLTCKRINPTLTKQELQNV